MIMMHKAKAKDNVRGTEDVEGKNRPSSLLVVRALLLLLAHPKFWLKSKSKSFKRSIRPSIRLSSARIGLNQMVLTVAMEINVSLLMELMRSTARLSLFTTSTNLRIASNFTENKAAVLMEADACSCMRRDPCPP
jgi:hypothetical protein